MADKFENKIKRLELENFTCFSKVAMDFSPGINVFIGENGMGKTHLLKVLYGLSAKSNFPATILEKIFKTFSETELISKGNDTSIITLNYAGKEKKHSIHEVPAMGTYVEESSTIYSDFDRLYLPPTEMLSWFKGFISAYENRESYIDETYYHLAKALDPLALKGDALEKQKLLFENLEKAIKAKVIRKGDTFFLAFIDEETSHPSQLVAQGINKIAQLIYLIMNGSLTKDTILFWDEPEANLNPKYIRIVAKFLQTLANAGCQIFVATHDTILPYELSLSKEYDEATDEKAPDMKFFALYKGENGTEVEEGETMPDLKHDSIHEGLARHNRREKMLFQKSLTEKK